MRPPRVEWRTVCIDDVDPQKFANNMQTALQMLSDAGFNILAQYARGAAQIILAQRVVQEQVHPPGPIPGPTMPAPPPLPHATRRAATPPTSIAEERFVYHFLSPQGPQDVNFTSMVEALRLAREHVDGDGSCVPGYLVAMSVTTFEAPAIGNLLRAYAQEIAANTPKQVD
jgi:hypothetical protein